MTLPRQEPTATKALPSILVVDDDGDDALLTKHVLLKAGVRNTVLALHNADEAMKHLRGACAAGPNPCLMFVDINLPQVDGFGLLAWARRQHPLGDLKIVILSGSEKAIDRKRSLELGADAYLTKHPNVAQMRELLATLRIC